MSRTYGHVGNRFGGAKRCVKDELKEKQRAKERDLCRKILQGHSCDSMNFPTHPTHSSNWWNWD